MKAVTQKFDLLINWVNDIKTIITNIRRQMTLKINLKKLYSAKKKKNPLSNQTFECYSQFSLLKGTSEKEN